jgi:spectrin beta
MSEQELYMMGEDRAKDENGANNMMKKHQRRNRARTWREE